MYQALLSKHDKINVVSLERELVCATFGKQSTIKINLMLFLTYTSYKNSKTKDFNSKK